MVSVGLGKLTRGTKMDGRRVYMLDEAAHKAGIRPSTLRLYVRLGHIIPQWGYNTEADRRIHRDRRRKCMYLAPICPKDLRSMVATQYFHF